MNTTTTHRIEEQSKCPGIYRIVNNVSNTTYIGSSTQMSRRLSRHALLLKRGQHGNAYLQAAWNKYGASVFTFECLITCDKERLALCEQEFMDAYREHGMILYNLRPCADSRTGLKYQHTVEQRTKISDFLRGRACSEETREKRRINGLGRKHSLETIIKLKQKGRGLGIPKSPEHIEKIRLALTGKRHSPETIEKLRLLSTGRKLGPHSLETRIKIGLAHKGRIFSEEHRANIRKGWIKRRSNGQQP